MDIQLTAGLTKAKKQRLGAWIKGRVAARLEHDSFIWRSGAVGLLTISTFLAIAIAFGMPTGFGAALDTISFALANGTAVIIASQLIALLLSMAYAPVPRQFIGFFAYTSMLAAILMYQIDFTIMDSILFAFVIAIVGTAIGIAAGLIWRYKWKALLQLSAAAAASALIAGAIAVPYGNLQLPVVPAFNDRGDADRAADGADGADDADSIAVNAIQADDPSLQGNYSYREFTYGSGKDRHRSSFGDEAELLSTSVDASAYITKWSWLKQLYWGFDEHNLPLNGTVWMPEGEGPFPLLLMVHGNHLMEDFSDGGYRYLGELMASRGIIAVSVDENFLNYSAWSGIPNHDFEARTWVLLKHLQQIQSYSAMSDNPFSNRVDFDRVSLLGHSRGGQAVAMAANADRWFAADRTLESIDKMQIKSVIALAPTDKAIDSKSAALRNVNYLTLQGARDGDVNSFYGDRQYLRTSFTPDSGYFKASLYIEEANHSRFNSDWGTMDESMPGGLLLEQDGMLDDDEQQQIAAVYVSAFLESTLKDNAYLPLFQDYRTGSSWLPGDTRYVSRYEDSTFAAAARFDEDSNKTTMLDDGELEMNGLSGWTETDVLDRDGKRKGTKGVALEWDDADGGSFALKLSDDFSDKIEQQKKRIFSFSMANIGLDDDEVEISTSPVEIAIELVTKDGDSIELPLNRFMKVEEPFETEFLTIPWLKDRIKDGKYKEDSEMAFQTFRLPLTEFMEEAGAAVGELKIGEINFHIKGGPGKLMLDDIGFSAE
ncbi:alpha/beta hydrolase [Paenibacillus sp. NEAU-GSW1]|uniref:alpha/beta hydrolase n=1 Tax=Paenibacillus sp. NEAU-GSW1 TaxID=2682486 RepID=UPI0012E11A3C|nr:alpha/beta hydrolase [Paenibacillus sp. NEAU-GSW1]MUT66699.1 alpha/beta hydrolase [Paenibacillus sp. NEAU-GSW1]